MRIQDVEHKFGPFDKSSAEGAYLISTGKFEKYVPPYNAPVPDLKWFAAPGERIEDTQWPPFIGYSCGVCGSKGRISGPSSTAQTVRHCLIAESVPEDVAARFNELRADYLKRFPTKKKAAAPVELGANGLPKFKDTRSAAEIQRDSLVAASLGLKSGEQLKQEAIAAAQQAARLK
jgi:hypothetical protein